jgi:hypothetical protein
MIVKTQTLREPYVHVYSGDDALDADAEGFVEAYQRAAETSGASPFPIRDGHTPALWTLRHLTSDEAAWLSGRGRVDSDGPLQIYRHAVALAVVSVEGACGEDGRPIKIEREPDPTRRGFTCVVPAQMEGVFGHHNRDLVEELGGRVLKSMRPTKG